MTREKRICDLQTKAAAMQEVRRNDALGKSSGDGTVLDGGTGTDGAAVGEEGDTGAFVENENFFQVIDAGRKLHPSSNDLWGADEVS